MTSTAVPAAASCSHTAVCSRLEFQRCRLPFHAQRALGFTPNSCSRRQQAAHAARRRSRGAPLAAAAPQSAAVADIVSSLERCEAENDWLKVVELLTEVRVLKLDLPTASYECCVRTLCAGGQWKPAVELMQGRSDLALSDEAVLDVLHSLVVARSSDAAQAALRLLEGYERGHELHAKVYNGAVRALARAGLLDEAKEMTDKMVMDDDLQSEWNTFTIVAKELLTANRSDDGLEVLEWRDYL